jgi:hypothetical protein
MTPFTDDDLKGWKEYYNFDSNAEFVGVRCKTIGNLLARLEAAESCIEAINDCHACGTFGRAILEYKAWCKSKGE